MSTDLDLSGVVAHNPLAAKQLDGLRKQPVVDAARKPKSATK